MLLGEVKQMSYAPVISSKPAGNTLVRFGAGIGRQGLVRMVFSCEQTYQERSVCSDGDVLGDGLRQDFHFTPLSTGL